MAPGSVTRDRSAVDGALVAVPRLDDERWLTTVAWPRLNDVLSRCPSKMGLSNGHPSSSIIT
ncbi:hypothetical protein [Natronosalvus vescus]|uniref:hypothetical protein n=1 Tax=Natronosalvus vescus TaxID=2953881 RepID=UPI00209064A1|nr:hypothetical protein [Natronosalvus vescus]